jgi:DAK2 domain fusion protein YloV
MSANYIDAGMLKKMFISGAYNLEMNKEWINELNVFPVPDGDTGTNMTLTILSAVDEVNKVSADEMEPLAKAVSHGSLRGARGNSGVILSQLLRGFTKEIREHSSIDNVLFAQACERAVDTAYKAVMKPKEGTILTVAKGMAKKASRLAKEEIETEEFLLGILEEGKAVLKTTPDLLPVLKEAGVVDSGGQGLVLLFEGAYNAFIGKAPEMPEGMQHREAAAAPQAKEIVHPDEEIKFGYCTEFIINIEKALPDSEVASLKDFLDSMGDSIVLVPDDDLVKIHVHTNEPGTVLQRALSYGELTRIKIDNMREEHREVLGLEKEHRNTAAAPAERKKYGFIAVCMGAGFESVFKDMGVDVVISGGQTMNPSTDDFLNAIKEINAENIFVFPNNKNIIMAANQARDLTEDKNIIVIPAKTVTQGITAMINYDAEGSPQENADAMNSCILNVRTSQVTYSIRDTHVDDFDIRSGDIMAVGDSCILAVGSSINDVAVQSVEKLVSEETELISVYYGEDFSEEDASALVAELEEKYPDCSVELIEGGQPVYYCIISVE